MMLKTKAWSWVAWGEVSKRWLTSASGLSGPLVRSPVRWLSQPKQSSVSHSSSPKSDTSRCVKTSQRAYGVNSTERQPGAGAASARIRLHPHRNPRRDRRDRGAGGDGRTQRVQTRRRSEKRHRALANRNAGRRARWVPARQRPLSHDGAGARRTLVRTSTRSAANELARTIPPQRRAARPVGTTLHL